MFHFVEFLQLKARQPEMAEFMKRKIYEEIGLLLPFICTPEELLGEEHVE